MNNNCQDCGKCCLETEMPLSTRDIERIIKNSSNTLKQEDFAIKTEKSYFQLKNINGRCYFLNEESKKCEIYMDRPHGCRFYPLIFDYDKNICVLDKECPRTNLFYLNNKDLLNTCKKIKKFLIEQLNLKL